jgi:hypothetical protein
MAQTGQESGNGYVFNTSLVYYSFTLPSAQCAIGLSPSHFVQGVCGKHHRKGAPAPIRGDN